MTLPGNAPAVYIIIPVHNRQATTLACLQHLQEIGDLQQYHVVVVDDGSTDGTAAAIHATYPQVMIVPGNGDLWWTGAIALGMQRAHEHGADYFIWLNDDCMPETGTLPGLIEFMQTHPNALAAPTCYTSDAGLLTRQHNGSQGRKGCAASPGEVVSVDGMSGWCVAIPAAVFSKIGPPDARKFPHYSGDDTYTFKATQHGFSAYLIGDLQVTLTGPVHDKLGFHKYFRPGVTAAQTLEALFWSKKSPYRIPTKFFHCIERYGVFLGMCLFLTKLIAWLGRWAQLQMAVWLRPESFRVQSNGQ